MKTNKIVSFIILAIMLFSSVLPLNANEIEQSEVQQKKERFLDFIDYRNHESLVKNSNFQYTSFVEWINSDIYALYALDMIDKFGDIPSVPDEKLYTETLVNIIATYDNENTDIIVEQRKMDNLKNGEDYLYDVASITSKLTSIYTKNSSETVQQISDVIELINHTAENFEYVNDELSYLQTILENYEKYDAFLQLVEENSDGELQSAAKKLRESFDIAILVRLETFEDIVSNVSKENSAYFFENHFFDVLKLAPEYTTNEYFKSFVDVSDTVISNYGYLQTSWEVGVEIGKLLGNITVGGENLVYRVNEMRAVYEISNILTSKLNNIVEEFLNTYESSNDTKIIDDYIYYTQFLISARIRGEYSILSVLVSDAALLNLTNMNSHEELIQSYQNKVNALYEIEKMILDFIPKIPVDFLLTKETEYYGSGDVKDWIVYEYDDSNNLSDRTYYNYKGENRGKTTFEYDENQLLIKEIRYDWSDSSSINYEISYNYSNDGKLLERTKTGEYTTEKFNYQYDTNGNLSQEIKTANVYRGGVVIDYYYDENSRLIKMVDDRSNLSNDGEDLSTKIIHEYYYDENDNLIKEVKDFGNIDNVGGVFVSLISTTEYIYDENHLLQSEIGESTIESYLTSITQDHGKDIYEYDENSNLIKESSYNKDGDLTSWIKYEYDENNNLIKVSSYEEDDGLTSWIEYEYSESNSYNTESKKNSTIGIEEIEKTLIEYYTEMDQPNGEYVIFDGEKLEDDEKFTFTLRFRMDQETADEIIAAGGSVSANVMVTTLYVDKDTLDVTDEHDNTWNINEYIAQ